MHFNTSIRFKISSIILAVSLLAIMFAIAIYVHYQDRMARSQLESSYRALIEIVGMNNAAALLFKDAQAAERKLASLKAQSDIISAQLYDARGKFFAKYGLYPTTKRPAGRKLYLTLTDEPFVIWQDDRVRFGKAVYYQGERVGFVHLIVSLQTLDAARNESLILALFIVLGAGGLALALASIAGRYLTRPVSVLVESMRQVTSNHDYGLHAKKISNDELGTLVDGFNLMLEEIQARHRELREHQYGLELVIDQRTRDLRRANDKLTESVRTLAVERDRAEEANRAKSRFLANMSHELRTPLNAINGFSEIIAKEMFGPVRNEQYREYATMINQSGNHLLIIVNDILDMSRVEAGKMQLHEEELSLDDLFSEVKHIVTPIARKKNISVSVPSLPDDFPSLYCDHGRLRHVFLNLLGNAIKFTSQGGVVGVNVNLDDDLDIHVEDNGVGIKEEDLARIMKPFVQVEDSYSRQYSGSGLGLAISKVLVEMHGGALTVESEYGVGTRVTITLPARRLGRKRADAAQGTFSLDKT
jgi:signal transduction histidine kinase